MVKRSILGWSTVLVALSVGCGGDGGLDVDGSAVMTSLSDSDLQAVCSWSIDLQGGPGHETDCGDGTTVSVQQVGDCTAGFEGKDCTLTVAEFQACAEASADNPCEALGSSACSPVFECLIETE